MRTDVTDHTAIAEAMFTIGATIVVVSVLFVLIGVFVVISIVK